MVTSCNSHVNAAPLDFLLNIVFHFFGHFKIGGGSDTGEGYPAVGYEGY